MLIVVVLCCKVSFAQYNFYRLKAGLGGGATMAFTDVAKSNISPAFSGSLDFNITPFVSAGIEIQKGTISAGDSIQDPHKRFFKNSYTAIVANGTIQLGQLMNIELNSFLYKIRGIYFGTGVGLIMNKQSEIVRTKINPDGKLYTFPGLDKEMELMVPSKIGYNYEIKDRWNYVRYVFFIEHQFNVAFGENLDGYHDPESKFKNKSPDMYSLTSFGIKYTFGPEGIY